MVARLLLGSSARISTRSHRGSGYRAGSLAPGRVQRGSIFCSRHRSPSENTSSLLMVNIGLGRAGGTCAGESDPSDTSDDFLRRLTGVMARRRFRRRSTAPPTRPAGPRPVQAFVPWCLLPIPGSRRSAVSVALRFCSVSPARRARPLVLGRGRCLVSSFAVVYASCRFPPSSSVSLSRVVSRTRSSLTGPSPVDRLRRFVLGGLVLGSSPSTTSSSTTTASPAGGQRWSLRIWNLAHAPDQPRRRCIFRPSSASPEGVVVGFEPARVADVRRGHRPPGGVGDVVVAGEHVLRQFDVAG